MQYKVNNWASSDATALRMSSLRPNSKVACVLAGSWRGEKGSRISCGLTLLLSSLYSCSLQGKLRILFSLSTVLYIGGIVLVVCVQLSTNGHRFRPIHHHLASLSHHHTFILLVPTASAHPARTTSTPARIPSRARPADHLGLFWRLPPHFHIERQLHAQAHLRRQHHRHLRPTILSRASRKLLAQQQQHHLPSRSLLPAAPPSRQPWSNRPST
jgi:hypothetical protein